MAYVYVFDFGDMVKVGTSIRPLMRLKELEKGNGVKAVRTFAINAGDLDKEIEQKVHNELRNYLLQGREYFSCSFETAHNTVVSTGEQVLKRHVSGIRVGGVQYSDAQKEATARYNKKAYDRIEIKVKKGRKAEIIDYAASKNKSVNQFIVELIDKEMNE